MPTGSMSDPVITRVAYGFSGVADAGSGDTSAVHVVSANPPAPTPGSTPGKSDGS